MISRKSLAIIIVTAIATTVGYLLVSYKVVGIGFPLDDAWIHQTYARNLVRIGEWSFIPGQPSGGSTAPLWSLLLSAGYFFGNSPFLWTFILGFTCLVGIGIIGDCIYRKVLNKDKSEFPWLGLFLVIEWHLVWAALSGMESLLLTFVLMLFFFTILHDRTKWWMAGLLVGVSVWIRPDGITLLGPALMVLGLTNEKVELKLKLVGKLLASFLIFFLPYLWFNFNLTGNIWPNTFFAKQAEYSQLIEMPFTTRFFNLATLPLIGSGLLLLPGFLFSIYLSWSKKHWVGLSAAIWWIGFTLIYSLRLPVVYQHGRYLIPAMPVYFSLGLSGWVLLQKRLNSQKYFWILLRKTWNFAIAGVAFTFLAIGGFAYATDVGIIQTEMVQTAKWLSLNTSSNSLIAAHDIGAIGFFSNRHIVDLAGLISPEVIPFIRDEDRLTEYLNRKGVTYLVTFPGWYPKMVRNSTLIYTTGGSFAPREGGENMGVFRWK